MVTNDNYLGAKTSQKEPTKYHCASCDYSTSKIANWKRHLKTKKHNDNQMVTDDNYLGAKTSQKEPNNAENKWICGCGKAYKYKSGLSRHKSTCTYIEEEKTKSDEKTVTLTHSQLQTIITVSIKLALEEQLKEGKQEEEVEVGKEW